MKLSTFTNFALATLTGLASPALAKKQQVLLGECTPERQFMRSCKLTTVAAINVPDKAVWCLDGEWKTTDKCKWITGHCVEYHNNPDKPYGEAYCENHS